MQRMIKKKGRKLHYTNGTKVTQVKLIFSGRAEKLELKITLILGSVTKIRLNNCYSASFSDL